MVWLLRWYEEYVETSLVCRELLCHFLWCLYHPEVECLCLYHEVVAIANLLLYLCNFLALETWNDTVNECGIYAATVVKPLLELLWKLPKLDVFVYSVLQHMAVEEDELAREDDKSLRWVAVKGLPTTVEQLYELARVRGGWSVVEFA